MARYHLVRVGLVGQVGRFFTPEGLGYPRNSRVVVRTDRGLEVGEVLGHCPEIARRLADGTLLRPMTVEDELLEARLSQNRDEAYQACAQRIADLQLPVVLTDVEHLLDGASLYFYFLGEPSQALDEITSELAELYAAKVEFKRFADTLTAGCGPDCGTESAAGAGCQSCATGCAIAGACAK